MDIWVAPVVVLLLLVLLTVESASATQRHRESTARIRRVERKLDLVLDHLGLTDSEPALPQILAHLEQGRKVAAVKAYRQATGDGLLAAKQAVDRLAEQRGL
ncbi:hypothetical protein [Plantactinospora endophytica]|uniref:Ribosomal protein L7/L12 C-terminal domain-containing protein n=1 Tax=Plantactinospora endophytica TaxID=673535 RepID=A0ABQ4DWQ5_9ACTN|nr:hypothetical protein [Plantactinospora endophytica]GIG86885.1 hypothetical protein Pen02_18210 [Plantactinospora endophytica]